jgi:8-oxo-dGTP diphosphatase
MKKYTLGFVFNSTLEKVLLIHKSRPAHHAGKVNGLGGKIEENENPLACIVREIKEEADLITIPEKWIYVGNEYSSEWHVEIFCYVYEGNIGDAKTMEDQKIEWFDVTALPSNIISNLTWLIPLCIDKIKDPALDTFVGIYKK